MACRLSTPLQTTLFGCKGKDSLEINPPSAGDSTRMEKSFDADHEADKIDFKSGKNTIKKHWKIIHKFQYSRELSASRDHAIGNQKTINLGEQIPGLIRW